MIKFLKILFILLVLVHCKISYAKDNETLKEELGIKGKDIKRHMKYTDDDKNVPKYRKTFDEYILDLEHMQKYNRIPQNLKKEKDLSKMNFDGGITLK